MSTRVALGLAVLAVGAGLWFLVIRKSDEERVRETIDGFTAAVHVRDFGAVCDRYLTTDLKERLQLFGTCSAVLRRSTANPAFDPQFQLHVKSVKVEGNRASADVETKARGKTATVTVRLAKQGGDWRLATLR